MYCKFIRENVENTWNTMAIRGKNGDCLIVYIMYVLGLKTEED